MPDPADRSPWLVLYRESLDELYGFVSRRCGGRRDLAEDVTQEVYLRALRAWSAGERPDRPLAWLKTIGRNLIATHQRRLEPRRLTEVGELAREPGTGSEPSADPEAAARLHRALARLRRGQAELLEAFYFDGRDTRSLAREHGLSERAVEGRLRRVQSCLLYTSPSPRDQRGSRMPSSA